VRAGWRWVEGGLCFSGRWETEDSKVGALERTKLAVHGSMQGIDPSLVFTMETGDDFVDGWLPTLDMSLFIDERNMVLYRFYEKPTTSKITVQEKSALGQNSKIQSLVNECIRRMLNTSELVEGSVRLGIVDSYAQKLLNSGFGMTQVRSILLSGLKGYERKLLSSRKVGGRALNLGAGATSHARRLKKLTGKTSWFRKRKREEVEESGSSDMDLGVATHTEGGAEPHPKYTRKTGGGRGGADRADRGHVGEEDGVHGVTDDSLSDSSKR
jgi:hypothetical protein